MTANILSGEQSNTKIVAVFDTKQAAEACAKKVQEEGLDPNQFDIIAPNEHNYSRKLEPENEGIKHTAMRSHTVFGLLGLVVGFILWGGLYLSGLHFIESSFWGSLAALLFFGTSAGLLLGGFITMRVDHQRVIQKVDSAIHHAKWALVAHPRNPEQTHTIDDTLHRLGVETVRSL